MGCEIMWRRPAEMIVPLLMLTCRACEVVGKSEAGRLSLNSLTAIRGHNVLASTRHRRWR